MNVRRLIWIAVIVAMIGGALGLWLTRPQRVDPMDYAELTGVPSKGELVYHAAGCHSCHSSPNDKDQIALVGGQAFPSDFGTFYAPNISSDMTHGIGAWSLLDFANAIQAGVSPDGKHYYPAFPYTNYARMTPQDVVDLWSYILLMPSAATPSKTHDVAFPFNVRRGLGLWKLMFMDESWVVDNPASERGQYIVEALAHCGECHTPRNALGGLDRTRWLQGAPNPSGRGNIPAITPSELAWDANDIEYYLFEGFTPDFDSVGGHMVPVVENMAKLPAEDRQAIATYLSGLAD